MSYEQKSEEIDNKLRRVTDPFGNLMVDLFHYIALFAIGGAIFWSAVMAFIDMASEGGASISDILLLFIYLELGAMVGIYFKTNHMPTRFLIYVGITALTRMLIGDIQAHHHDPGIELLYITGSILLLALANLAVRFGSHRYPSPPIPKLDSKGANE
ncbi:phosphate-starvation-inducible PsiE family protein [Marinobacter salinisoli]|uniref:Protein PsiE n=1 Tax=Marinobacter salinisoli TaxID=2769486 RepID=A0ABX7MME7_9GAMM|nr:phosphate-starvation-inducible PsiE family protein [Marinobacter salinisoli]QSP93375.1 phosphate-starvation-inducible PsiE family protein [Marinobacter salinisoli]